MARYFFSLTDGIPLIQDLGGELFNHDGQARSHAIQVAQELARNGGTIQGRSITVTNEEGAVIFTTEI
jgi:hypothetical protein